MEDLCKTYLIGPKHRREPLHLRFLAPLYSACWNSSLGLSFHRRWALSQSSIESFAKGSCAWRLLARVAEQRIILRTNQGSSCRYDGLRCLCCTNPTQCCSGAPAWTDVSHPCAYARRHRWWRCLLETWHLSSFACEIGLRNTRVRPLQHHFQSCSLVFIS